VTLHRIANEDYLVELLETIEKAGQAWWINLLVMGVVEEPKEAESERYAPLEFLYYIAIRRLRDVITAFCYFSFWGILDSFRRRRRRQVRVVVATLKRQSSRFRRES
jgi:hypothetical protein